jgi:hypothetical protein
MAKQALPRLRCDAWQDSFTYPPSICMPAGEGGEEDFAGKEDAG